MSWDLFFVAPDNRTLPAADVLTYVRSTQQFAISPDEPAPEAFEAVYMNVATGVRFELSYSDSSLSANINYARPSFFAHEAMPILERLAHALDLRVDDPQDESHEQPTDCHADWLIASWEQANEQAVRSVVSQGARAGYMPRDRAMTWWRTMREFGLFGQTLEEKLGRPELFIPAPVPAVRVGTIDVYSTGVLSLGAAQVLPACDYFEVLRPHRNRFMPWRWDHNREPERGYLQAEQVYEQLESLLEPLPGSTDQHFILPEEHAKMAHNLLKDVPLEPPTAFRIVNAQAFVDVDFREFANSGQR